MNGKLDYYLILDQRVEEKAEKKDSYTIFYDLMDLVDGKIYENYRVIIVDSLDEFENWRKVA
jgi:hypothetical protein